MKKEIFLSFFYLVFILISVTKAQPFLCGTVVTPEVIAFEKSAKKMAFNVPDRCLNKTISLYFHIVLDSNGKGNVTIADINSAVSVLNADFKPICLDFKVCKIDTIHNWKYDLFHKKKELDEVIALYNTPRVANVYLVETIEDPAGAGGFAPLADSPPPPKPSDAIVLDKQQISGVISHEFGHFFGLYHTFETQFGLELADESNCATTGDLICDTEADINPVSMNGCQYTGTDKDPAGNYYTPPIGNIMAYHPCKSKFTVGQYDRMVTVFLLYRYYLL